MARGPACRRAWAGGAGGRRWPWPMGARGPGIRGAGPALGPSFGRGPRLRGGPLRRWVGPGRRRGCGAPLMGGAGGELGRGIGGVPWAAGRRGGRF